MGIKENVKAVLSALPPDVMLVAATKTRRPEEILEAVDAGIKIIGDNYVQEAERKEKVIGNKVKYHFIGHLQRNKVRKIIGFMDMIETVDSFRLAEEINKRAALLNKVMPILIEINSGRESQKAGLFPEDVEKIVRNISDFQNLKIMGFMTMGPRFGNPEDSRPYFIETKKVFEMIKSLNIPNVEMKYLSMGMSNTYRIAIEEGANIVRVGTGIFGPRA